MNRLRQHLTHFLTTQNAWILVIAILLFSFQWVMTFRVDLLISYVYLDATKWWLFFHFSVALLLVFSPHLAFCSFRRYIRSRVSTTIFYVLWISVFALYPFIIGQLRLAETVGPIQLDSTIIWMLANVLLLIDLLTSPDRTFGIQLDYNKWINRISLDRIVLFLFVLLSLYYTFHLQMETNGQSNLLLTWLQALVLVAVYYLHYLVNHFVLVNHIYKPKGIIYYLFSLLGLTMMCYVPLVLIHFYLPAFRPLLTYQLGEHWIGQDAPAAFWSILSGVAVPMVLISVPLTILIQWLQQDNRIQSLQKEKLDTELSMLKQQINPHFFFNTLNNVYSMSLTKDEKTSESILQLSDLMRYVIYKGQEKTVTLSEEIQYLQDYLDLQKMRLSQKFDMRFDQDIEDGDTLITPLLFIILIENAFKHGIEGAEGESFLHISLMQSGMRIEFSVRNSKHDHQNDSTGGVGLTNLKRRLELLYPGQYELSIDEKQSTYLAKLNLDLNSISNNQ